MGEDGHPASNPNCVTKLVRGLRDAVAFSELYFLI